MDKIERIKELENEVKDYKEVLFSIVEWGLPLKFRVDFGSNGQRDYFREQARIVLKKHR